MEERLREQMDGLLEKYTELLIGDPSAENIEKVKMWMIYNHIAKSMPALAKHWNQEYPDGKEEIMKAIAEIKQLNELKRQK